MISQFQKFKPITIHRSRIKNAPYNPRKIEDAALAKLKKNIKKRGLLTTLCWNEQTGNLVSGHQRLRTIDTLEGTEDYELTVAACSLSPKEEKEQNTFFNNQNAQGEFDDELMQYLFNENPDLDFKEMGFSLDDLNMFGIETADLFKTEDAFETIPDIIAAQPQPKAKASQAQPNESSDKPSNRELYERDKVAVAAYQEKTDTEYYIVVVCRDRAHRESILTKYSLDPDTRYISADTFDHMLAGANE